jgi:multidrug efflux pump subunit AcrA (membrane-fusion protein)
MIWLFVLVLIGAAGATYYFKFFLPSQVEPAPAFNTSKVRTGDIIITTSGVGNLIPAEKVMVGFQISGVLKSLNVGLGDIVEAGDVLASLDDVDLRQKLIQAEANLKTFFTPQSVNEAEMSLINARTNNNKAQDDLIDLIGVDQYNLEVAVDDAQFLLEELRGMTGTSETELEAAEEAMVAAQENLSASQPDDESEDAITLARVKLKLAEFDLKEAETYLAVLQDSVDGIDMGFSASPGSDFNKLQQAKLDYDKALADLEKMTIKAPIQGTVTELNANIGQTTNNAPFITLESLDNMLFKFYVEERDLSLLQVGQPVEVTFDAYPDTPVGGSIIKVEPVLKIFEGSSVAVVWAALNEMVDFPLLSGMSADVEVIAAETRNALLVPIQALREISPGSYSVFVVQPDGTLRLVVVSVGLQDYANAEILGGLNQGDIISTGSVETK